MTSQTRSVEMSQGHVFSNENLEGPTRRYWTIAMNNKIRSILVMIAAFAAVAADQSAKPIKSVQRGPARVIGTIRWSRT